MRQQNSASRAGGMHQRWVSLLAFDLAAAGHGLDYVEALVVHHHPSPRSQGERRAAQEVRNILLTAWLRRRGAAALRITGRVCRTALRDRDARSGTLTALARFPTVVRHRQAVPPDVERDAATLEHSFAFPAVVRP